MRNRSACIALLLLLFPFWGKAQAPSAAPDRSYHVTVDLLNVTPDKDRVKVTITPPEVHNGVVRYVLPAYLPGVPGRVDAGRFIHQFYALDEKGFPLKVKKKGENVIAIQLRKGSSLKKIEYWIDDTWDHEKSKPRMSDEKFNYVPQAAGSNIDAGTNYVLNHAFVFGYLEGYADLPYTVHVLKPAEMEASCALDVISLSRTRDEYHAASYAELVDNPVMYCAPDTAGFLSGKIYVTVSVFSENGKVSARFVRKVIAAQVAACSNFMPEAGDRTYKMIFYFTTPFKTVRNVNGSYGGLAHLGSAFYFMPELAAEDALTNEIIRETTGDLFRLLPPLDFHTTCGRDQDFLQPQLRDSWWFSQGAGVYFGWLATIRDSFASEKDFMGFVSAKIRHSQLVPKKPLTDLALVQSMSRAPLSREAIRSKALLTVFLLDIRLTALTGGRTGLREAVMTMSNDRFFPDSLEAYLVRTGGPGISDFFRDYVRGNRPLPLIESLGKIGWAYAPETVDSVLTFGQFGLMYDDERDVFFVHNADTLNRFGLRDGDRLISVDNVIVGAANFEDALFPVYHPTRNEEVEIRFIRSDQNHSSKASPTSIAIIVEHLIRSDPAAGEEAQLLHRHIFTRQH